MYKIFVRPHLDYGNVIYGKVFNESFHKKLESAQYNAVFFGEFGQGSIRGANTENFNQELGLESLPKIRKLRRLCYFCKIHSIYIFKNHTPPYLLNSIPTIFQKSYSFRATKEIFESSFFTSTIIEWNNLDYSLHNAPSISA